MSNDVQPQAEAPRPAPEAPKSRVPALVRWAVRLTSLPVLALALVTLVPTLVNYGVSARDDRMIALGLCGVCLGYLVGWKWPVIGGAVSLAGIGVILKHDDSALSGDPFSIAFALQAILFLVSGILNLRSDRPAAPRLVLVKRAAIGVLALCAIGGIVLIYRGPGPMVLPKEKARYVGAWECAAGLTIELTEQGEAKVTQSKDSKVAACNSPIKPGETKVFNAAFLGDDRLELSSGGLGEAKVYHIDRRPRLEGKLMKMVLNASDPYQRTNGILLVKKEEKKPAEPAPKNSAPKK